MPSLRCFFTVMTAMALLLMLTAAVRAAERVALVIGNTAYEHTTALRNPRNDATDVARALEGLGFAVVEGLDLDKSAFGSKLREFAQAARGAQVTLFFYAGHGLQVEGENYLVPTDAKLADEVDLRLEAFELTAFLRQMRGGTSLVFLDACRDNPLAQSLARAMGPTRSSAIGRGLGRVDAGSGTLIAYATQPGNVADDGEGRNSPFTGALLAHIATPGLSVDDLLAKVTDDVMKGTGERQQPWRHSSLRKPFYFKPAATAAPVSSSPASTDPTPKALESSLRLEREDKRLVQRALASLGFDPGPADGLIGPRTRVAIRRYQGEKGFEATGYLRADEAQVLVALGKEAAAGAGEMQAMVEVAASEQTVKAAPASAVAAPSPQPAPERVPERVSDPSAVVLASGLRLSDWVMLSEDRLAAGEHRALLVEGMGHIRAHGVHEPVETVVERAVAGLVGDMAVTDDASARTALRTVERIRGVAGSRAELSRIEAAAHARVGQFSQAVEAYRTWLRLASSDHPDRREMLVAMQRAERGERSPAVGERFRDCPECPWLVVVPSGSFKMGSSSGEEGGRDDQGPVHLVTIAQPFAVGVHQLTRGEFGRFVREAGHSMGDSCRIYEGGEWKGRSGRSWRSPGYGQADTHPVVCVSWDDAKAYVRWLSRETGERYRLLSESEWEYVARAGTTASRYWGDDSTDACAYANVFDRSARRTLPDRGAIHECRDGYVHTSPVGSFSANPYGLRDILGNVWEWAEDCWHGSYAGAPGDGRAWTSGGDCSRRVLRGGSWNATPRGVRSTIRSWYTSGYRNANVGFRIARTLD